MHVTNERYIHKSIVSSILSAFKPFLQENDDRVYNNCNCVDNVDVNWKIILKANRVQSLRPGIFRYEWGDDVYSNDSELIEINTVDNGDARLISNSSSSRAGGFLLIGA